jgi:hypothetical protein
MKDLQALMPRRPRDKTLHLKEDSLRCMMDTIAISYDHHANIERETLLPALGVWVISKNHSSVLMRILEFKV